MDEKETHCLPAFIHHEESGWNPRDNGKKRLIWSDDEVLVLLKLMQKQSLTSRTHSHSQLAEVLVRPLRSMGINKSVYQIRSKLKNVKKSYLQCKKHGCSPATLKECPYYDILCTIYENNGVRLLSDSDNENCQEVDDKTIWSEKEIKKMLSVIDELNLAHELSLTSFSLGALRLISKAMRCSGLYKNVEHVKTALLSLKTSYIESRKNGSPEQCPYYDYLDEIWGSDEIPDHIITSNEACKRKNSTDQKDRGKSEFWSEEETIVLLTSIKELDIIDDAYKCTDTALTKLHNVLKDSGYMRSKNQIGSKLENLKLSFVSERHPEHIEQTFRRFPFYHLYESLFGTFFVHLDTNSVSRCEEEEDVVHPLDMLSCSDTVERRKHNRSPAWSEEETILMLALIQEMNLVHDIKERMTVDIVSKLAAPLSEHGFCRTAGQIKIKLKNLRTSYQKCYQAGCTPQALADCPFYNRLHAIFRKPAQSKKLDTVRRLEPIDHSYVNISETSPDHSYTEVHGKEKSIDVLTPKKVKFAASRQEKNDVWLPVETITDENIEDLQSLKQPLSDQTDKVIEYNDDEDQDSDVSHVTGFEEVDEKELYDVNNIEMSSKDEFSHFIDTGMHDSIGKEIEESPNFPTHFIEKRGTVGDLRPKLKVEDELAIQEVFSPKTSVNGSNSTNVTKSKSVLKRKRSPTSDDTAEDCSKQTRQSDTESPFTNLLGRRDVSSNTLNKAQESIYIKSMRIVMSEVLTHEKWMQEQHHMWMERQFEIQRKHDRDQRELLLNELRELRRAITSTLLRPKIFDS